MDQYDDSFKLDGGGYNINNANDVSLRRNLGYTRSYAERMNLVAMTPRGDLASSGYCLANPAATGAEYLVYLPSGGAVNVNLAATSGNLSVEWFNPSNGATTSGGTVAGGANRSFTPPFSGDAVLYLSGISAGTNTPTATATSLATDAHGDSPPPAATPTWIASGTIAIGETNVVSDDDLAMGISLLRNRPFCRRTQPLGV